MSRNANNPRVSVTHLSRTCTSADYVTARTIRKRQRSRETKCLFYMKSRNFNKYIKSAIYVIKEIFQRKQLDKADVSAYLTKRTICLLCESRARGARAIREGNARRSANSACYIYSRDLFRAAERRACRVAAVEKRSGINGIGGGRGELSESKSINLETV